MLSALSPARRRLVLVGVRAVLVAVLVAVIAVVASGGSTKATPAPQDRPGPVVLVPGYGGSTTALDRLAVALQGTGRDARVVSLPGGGTGDLTVQARALATAADTALKDSGAPSVDVVGYSAGGVVTRIWIKELGGAGKVRRVVTLGSPQHGTDIAALAGQLVGCPVACQQLEPDSAVLATLNRGDETPAGPEWISVWSTVDQVVVPPDSARLDGAINLTVQSICPASTVAHGSLPTDPVVTAIVLAELDSATTSTFISADCARLGG